MKTVSTAFKEAQKATAAVSVRRVSYKRRYWVEASKAYTWEAAWTILPEDQIVSVSPITGKLDTDTLNEFKISNVNLVLKNERRQWKAGKQGGYFGPTTSYPDGFEPYWTKFRIESGYDVAGTATYTPLFVGVATGFNTSAASDTIQVDVRGLEALLENANAENVSTLVKYENMGTGNGSNKDFTTVHPGVGIIKEVSLNGIAKKPGTDYSISQLNEPTLGAKISFTAAPSSGVVVRVTYRYWKQNKKIEEIVVDLLVEAGVSVGAEVENVFFPGGVSTNISIDSQSDWSNSSTADKTDITSVPGDLRIDRFAYGNGEIIDTFSDANYTSSPAWTISGGGYSASSGYLTTTLSSTINTTSARVTRSDTVGRWRADMSMSYGSLGYLESVAGTIVFLAGGWNTNAPGLFQAVGSGKSQPTSGYGVTIFDGYYFDGSGYQPGKGILIHKFSGAYPAPILSYTSWNFSQGTNYKIEITRNSSGVMSVYVDGSLKVTVTDTSYTSSSYFGILSTLATSTGASSTLNYDNFYFSNKSVESTWESNTFDLLSTPTGWGTVVLQKNITGGASVSVYTRTSSDGTTWDAYSLVGPYGNIGSALKRYLRLKIYSTEDAVDNTTASVQKVTIPYTSATLGVTMMNLTGKTVYQAMQDIGSFANYEWGFDEQEIFFFRSKMVDLSVDEVVDSSTNMVELSNISDGTDRVYSEVQATYGNFDITVGDDGMTKEGPIARFGKRRLTIDGGDILLAPDTDIATGVAIGFYAALKAPRRTMKAKTKLMEWLDLSDTVSVTFNDNIPERPWFFGDTSANFGDKSLYLFGDADQTAKNMLCKVTGYRHDTENKTSEFDLEEILQ